MVDTYPTMPSVGDTRTRPDGTVEMCTDATAPYTWEIIGGSLGPGITKQVFTPSGSYTYTPSAGMRYCIVEVVGGGGGGGAAASTGATGDIFCGGGGGSGAYSRSYLTAADVGSGQTVTVGGGGGGGSAGTNNGSAGSQSSFGSLVTAGGGSGGDYSGSGGSYGYGGGGGAAGTGDFSVAGSCGEGGYFNATDTNGVHTSGRGGMGYFGGGGKPADIAFSTTGAGGAGSYGGGGAGGWSVNSTSSAAGGAGGDGICIVTEFLGESYGTSSHANIGEHFWWDGPAATVPANALVKDGSTKNRADYPVLWNVINAHFNVAHNLSESANTVSGTDNITNISDTSLLLVGQEVSGTGIPAGAKIASIDSSTQISMDVNATATAAVTVTFAPGEGQYGDGDGSTTFDLQDMTSSNRFIRAADGTTISVGDIQADGAPDIDGSLEMLHSRIGSVSGALSIVNNGVAGNRGTSGSNSVGIFGFAASDDDATYSDSVSEIRPTNVAMLPCIRAL